MGKALGIVYRTIATHLAHKAGYKKSTARTGAVTLIQRSRAASNCYIYPKKKNEGADGLRVSVFYQGVLRNWQTTHYQFLTEA